ncbi:hypothetical protein [Patulibacter defluvii]|uniref:hypothetical protein n=1 Tax=Patulibacter defluvii TaxID=3095358 RepID=UPI002A763425|nr:hypothetical protein [Patulibacter sp. DM4]
MREPPLPLRVLRWVVVLVLALALSFAILRLAVQDDSATDAPGPTATGTVAGSPPNGPPAGGGPTALLRAGNAVVTVRDRDQARQVRQLAADLGAPDTAAIRAAGQAVVVLVDRDASAIVARVGSRRTTVESAADPALRTFLADGLGG